MLPLRALWPLLALPLTAQTTPWDILSTRTIVTPFVNADEGGSLLAPNGDVFVAASPCPGVIKPTSTYGTPSSCDTVVARINPAGNFVFAIQLAGVDDGGPQLFLDPSGNIFVGGQTNSPSRFLTTPGAYLPTVPQTMSTPGFVCKLAAADGTPIFCTFLDDTATIVTVDAASDLFFTQLASSTPSGNSYTIRELDPAGAKLLLVSVPVSGPVGSILPNADGTFFLAGQSFYGKFDPNAGFLFTQNFSSNASFSIYMQPSVGPILAGNFGSGYEVRQYAADGTTIVYDRSLPWFPGGDLSVVDGSVLLIGLATSATVPLLHNLHVCGQLLGPYGGGPMMVRLDSSGAIVQTTWLGTATFGSLVLTSNSGWSALGSLSQNPGTDSSNIVIQVLSVGPSPAAQTQTIGCMADLAQGTNSKVVPGLLVALTIENDAGAGPVTAQPDSNGLYPTSLAGFAVTFDGIPMPLFALNGTQLTGAVPFSVAGKSTSQMCIAANCAAIDVTAVAPSVFSTVVNQDGTLNSPNNPAPSGSIVTVYVLGLGPLSPAVPDGRIVSPPLSQLTTQIQIEFPTGVANEAGPFSPAPPPAIAVVTYAGPAPFEVAGVYQINVRVPAGVLESVTILVGPPAAPVASTYVHVSLSN